MMSVRGTFCLVCIVAVVALVTGQISSAESEILFLRKSTIQLCTIDKHALCTVLKYKTYAFYVGVLNMNTEKDIIRGRAEIWNLCWSVLNNCFSSPNGL